MSWQRINENTYIDDTLVTCAEYQLFIDEMREQGKYYQPDHWTSQQHPDGQARAPVLGIRHSTAIVLCKWLTERENKEYRFRLPIQTEVTTTPIKPFAMDPVGYWLSDNNRFTWAKPSPDNIHALDLDFTFDLDLGIARDITYEHALTYSNQPVDYENFVTFRDLTRFLGVAKNIGQNRERARTLLFKICQNRGMIALTDFDIAQSLALDLDFRIARTLRFDLNHNFEYFSISYGLAPILDLILTLHLFIDLTMLQERIAGRSPAFEGIRLVKERIK